MNINKFIILFFYKVVYKICPYLSKSIKFMLYCANNFNYLFSCKFLFSFDIGK